MVKAVLLYQSDLRQSASVTNLQFIVTHLSARGVKEVR